MRMLVVSVIAVLELLADILVVVVICAEFCMLLIIQVVARYCALCRVALSIWSRRDVRATATCLRAKRVLVILSLCSFGLVIGLRR
jgi:hypothetical protein